MNWMFGFLGIAFLVIGLIGHAFEMRKIRLASSDEGLAPANIFTNKKNFKMVCSNWSRSYLLVYC